MAIYGAKVDNTGVSVTVVSIFGRLEIHNAKSITKANQIGRKIVELLDKIEDELPQGNLK